MILGLRTSSWVAVCASVAFTVLLVSLYWSGDGVTWESAVVSTATGLAVGSLYAMTASGLVVVYTTTGVFNFAQGAIGVFGAFVYWELRENRGLPALLAIIIVVLLIAPVLGVVLDVVLMRRLRTAPLVVQLMVTVGLMVFLLVLVGQIWDQGTSRRVKPLFENKSFDLGPVNLLYDRVLVVIIAVVIALGLRILLFQTRLGVAMRAVVDNRDLAGLNGARADVVSSFAWALGSGLAALAGILVAPEVAFNPLNLNNIIFVALAAAVCGRLKSLPWTVAGALLIGLLESHSRLWIAGAIGSYPFYDRAVAPIVLLLVLLALPQSRLEVGRLASNLKPRERTTSPWEGMVGGLAIVLVVAALSGGWLHFGIWNPGAWDEIGLNWGIQAFTLALIALSLVPLTGWAGQVNFAPLAFAGFGAWIYQEVSGGSGTMAWVPLVGLICAPLGALVALPAARLRGLYLALMSMSFVQLMSLLFFPHPDVFVAETGKQFEDLHIGGWTFDSRREFLILLSVAFSIGVVALVILRRSRFGRRWVALNDSQAASATVGINVIWTKVVVYATSAALAGMAGVFWATSKGNIDKVRDFDLLVGIEVVLLMAAAGMSMPAAGLFLSFRFIFLALAQRLEPVAGMDPLVWILDQLAVFGPGLLAIGMVANQRGAFYEMGRGFAPILPWRHDAREEMAAEKASKREVEIGDLGLTRPFDPEVVHDLDRRLGIVDDLATGAAASG